MKPLPAAMAKINAITSLTESCLASRLHSRPIGSSEASIPTSTGSDIDGPTQKSGLVYYPIGPYVSCQYKPGTYGGRVMGSTQ